jgi:hypothetical protein
MDAVVQQLGDNVVFVDVQRGSSNYGSPSGDVVTSNVKPFATYTPSFWLIDDSVTYSDMSSESKAVNYSRNKYNELEAQGVKAHIAFEYTISGNTLTVNTLTKFFTQMSGDYYVNIMLLESGFEAEQAGAPGGTIIASRVLRVIFSGENGAGDEKFWDTQIANGTTDAGTEVSKTFSTTLNQVWDQTKLTVVATIWYKSGNTIKAISAEDVPGEIGGDTQAPTVSVTSPTATDELEIGSEHDITWTASDNVGVVARALYFSDDNGSTWTKVDSANSNTGTFTWTVPSDAADECKIKVFAYDAAGNVGDSESGTFKIIPATGINNQLQVATNMIRFKRTSESFLVYLPFKANYSVTVTDVRGKTLCSFNTSRNKYWYDIGQPLGSGIHILKIGDTEHIMVKKFRNIK